MTRRSLTWLIPCVALLAAKAPVRVQVAAAQVVSVRAATEHPESARTESSRSTSVLATNGRAVPRAARPGEHSALPEFRNASSDIAERHARETGLGSVPAVARALAIPFYATAPPRSA